MSSIATEVLTAWRELERARDRLCPGDERAAVVAEQIEALRRLYQQLTDTTAGRRSTATAPQATLARCHELLASLPPPS